ncbi:MAG: FAD binding domain-containing protein [Pseudolabrys sp.]
MPTKQKAIVVGGSMAGLLTALLLRLNGWGVEIFERNAAELSGRGAGIVTHAELFDVMKRAGVVKEPAALGVPVAGRRVLNRDGSIACELALEQVVTSWGSLYSLLRGAMPDDCYHLGFNLERIDQSGTSVSAHFSGNRTAHADLMIGADGIFSKVRRLLAPNIKSTYASYVAWRGLVDESALSPATREALCDHFAFSLPPGEQMLGYPVSGPNEEVRRGARRFNFVWYRPAPRGEALDALLTDVDGITHELSIPPDKIRPQVVANMRLSARALLAPQFAEVIECTTQPFIQAIQDLETPTMVLAPRIAILGDAAFVARPHIGMGVTKAAGDAAALADSIAANPGNLAAALASFDEKRLPFGAAVVRRARDLGTYMQAHFSTDEERQLAERHRSPKAIMAETAVAAGIAV